MTAYSHLRCYLLYWGKPDKDLRTSTTSLKTKKKKKKKNPETLKDAAVFLPGVRSNRLIPLSAQARVSFDFNSRSLLKLYLTATSILASTINFRWIISQNNKKNPITSKDGIINSQLYVLMGHKGSTKCIKYKKSIRFISGTISTYSTTKSI